MKTETTLAPPHIQAESSARPRQTFYQRYEGTILGAAPYLLLSDLQAIWSYTTGFRRCSLVGLRPLPTVWISLTQGNLLADLAFSGKTCHWFAIALVTGVVLV